MKSITLIVVCFLSLNVWAQNKNDSLVAQSVLQLHQKKFEWMVHKQLDSLKTILDERLMYVHSNGWIENKQQVIDDLQSGKLIMNNVTITESNARIYNNTAIVNGKGIFNVVVEGKAVEIQLLYTEVYVKNNNTWLLASRHANRMN